MDADVIIVGAGPAGATAGKFLASNGISTLIVDKSAFPRKKVCAGGLMVHSFENFPYIRPFINCYNYHVQVFSPNLHTKFDVFPSTPDTPLMAMTNGREDFDFQLLNLAQKEGAQTQLQSTVKDVHIEADRVSIILANGDVLQSRFLIAADSANSTIARSLGIGFNRHPEHLGLGIEKEYRMSEAKCDELFGKERRVSLFLHFSGMEGYGWVFPRKSSVNVGIGGDMQKGREVRRAFERLIAELKHNHGFPNEITDEDPTAAVLPVTFPTYNTIAQRVFLVGDAGGFCSAATGEGIYYAMMSGKLAADSAIKLLSYSAISFNSMMDYCQRWNKVLGHELKFQYHVLQYVLRNERRCRKAVNWATQDPKLLDIFGKFLTGAKGYQKLPAKMGYHYIRCKIKEKMGMFHKPTEDMQFETDMKHQQSMRKKKSNGTT
jgi:geranylgeranyl reductase family protein